jgi:Lar family restriction alleviation protein
MSEKLPKMPELAACPFCGGDASLGLCGLGTARVACMDCGSEGTFSPSREDAIAAWNRRSLQRDTWMRAMEVAAKVCDDYEAAMWQAYKHGHGPQRASDYCQGQSDGAGDCANAIRALPMPEGGE